MILSNIMRKSLIVIIVALFVTLVAQTESKNKKRKVYRTQTGSIIEAPKPLFNRDNKKFEGALEQVQEKARLERIELKYNEELDAMKSRLDELYILTMNRPTDTVFVYTTIYDSVSVYDTSFVYTNATTTVYDTVVVIDSIYINNYDTTTIVQTNYDTTVVFDTTFIYNYDTTVVHDTVWAYAYDSTFIYDTSWVFAYDTTIFRDSLWLFAFDSTVVYDTLYIYNNDTITIHTHSTGLPPDITEKQRSKYPRWNTLEDAVRARDTGDRTAQEWINKAVYEANGDWSKASDEYKKLQKIYSTDVVKRILDRPKTGGEFIGPELQYRSVVFDTLKILSFDTAIVKDTVRDLYRQTYLQVDTSKITQRRDIVARMTPPGHELTIRYHPNGNVRERGLLKNGKRNGLWIFYDKNGIELRKTSYENGRIIKDHIVNMVTQNPMEEKAIKKSKKQDKSKAKKNKGLFKFRGQ